MQDQIKQALQALKTHFDKENSEPSIFTTPQRFKAALADTPIESDGKKIRNLLNTAIGDMKAFSRLESGLSGNNPFVVDNLVSEMVSDYTIDKVAAQTVIECIAELLGYVSKPPTQSAQNSQPKIPASPPPLQSQPTPAAINDPLLKRAFMFLEDGEWKLANEYCERVLDADPENAMAYIGKLCAELQVKDEAGIANCKQTLDNMPNYKKALRFADVNCQATLIGYNHVIIERIAEEQRWEQQLQQLQQRIERLRQKRDNGIKTGPQKNSNIPFGNYEWRVLDVQDDKALILSENVIEQRPYNVQYTSVTWETCTLQKYLNNEFLQKFTVEQQRRIVETRVTNNDNLWYGTKGGNDTMDKVFLLSLEEVDRYFGDSGDYQSKRRKNYKDGKFVAANDGYCFSNTHDGERVAKLSNKSYGWWLRSSGGNVSRAAFVFYGGGVIVLGDTVSLERGGVRPALWLHL